jgi:hypothetical protein
VVYDIKVSGTEIKKYYKGNTMNFQRLPHRTPFSLDTPLPTACYIDGVLPRITALVRDPSAQILLLLPARAKENANAFMLPQGPIERHQTPRDAVAKLLWTECRYESSLLAIDQARALGISPVEKSENDVTKIHHIVFISLRRFRNPTLNADNRGYLFARGPNNLWSKIHDCRPEKKRLIIATVFKAVDDGLLHTVRWNRDRFKDIRGFGIV